MNKCCSRRGEKKHSSTLEKRITARVSEREIWRKSVKAKRRSSKFVNARKPPNRWQRQKFVENIENGTPLNLHSILIWMWRRWKKLGTYSQFCSPTHFSISVLISIYILAAPCTTALAVLESRCLKGLTAACAHPRSNFVYAFFIVRIIIFIIIMQESKLIEWLSGLTRKKN